MLSKIPTKTRYRSNFDSKKKKILFVLALIFIGVVFYGLYNLSKVAPVNEEKIPIKISTGDQPMTKEIKVVVNTEGHPLNIRKEGNETSDKIGQIPDKTQITVQQELNGWYKVVYYDQEGWISKQYTVLIDENQSPQVDKTANWQRFTGSGYAFKYPQGWHSQNYTVGETPIRIGFSNNELPKEPGVFLPIELKVYSKVNKPSDDFRDDPGVQKENLKVAGVEAVRYTFVSYESSTEINIIEFEYGESVYNFYDNGGYLEDLKTILNTFEFTL